MSKVLVVEDDEDVFELIRFEFESRGYTVTKISVAAVAEAVVAAQDYDLFIVDLGLVGGDGKEVLSAINKSHAGSRSKIIVHTAADLTNDEIQQLKMKCADVVRKDATSIARILEIATS